MTDAFLEFPKMTAEPELARAFDFLCEHTPAKSRVMALVGHHGEPRSLAAVLTCKDKDHAYQAVQVLRRALAARDGAQVAEDLQTLAAALPDAPAGSLRQAVGYAATGTWPAAAETLYLLPPDEADRDADDEPDQDPEADGPATTPHGARLKDLPGKVVRIAHLREFHVIDEDALVREAMSQGWEPVPASELDDDDPRDLVGAVMTLTEQGGSITGADTLEDQSEAALLRVEDHDELADWSERPIRTRFTHGWRLRQQPAYTRKRPQQDEAPLDLVALFPVKDCGCADEECEDCGWQLTPRTADLLLTALCVLGDQAYDDAEELGDHRVSDHESGNWEVFTRLPALTFGAKRRWRRKMARAFGDLARDIERGGWPQPSCTAEEMALHLAIQDAPTYLEDVDDQDGHTRLPTHRDDYDWGACSDMFFQDHDVLMLFDARLMASKTPARMRTTAPGRR